MRTIVTVLFTLVGLTAHAGSKQDIAKRISQTAEVAGIDPDLAVAIATIESGLNPNAVGSSHGELGLFQLRPEYHSTIAGNARHNMLVGIAYLLELKTRFKPKYGSAWFVAFNYGPTKVQKLKAPQETAYYHKVMREVNKLKVQRYLAVR